MKTFLTNISIHVQKASLDQLECDTLVLPMFKESPLPAPTKELDKKWGGIIEKRIKRDLPEPDAEKTLWIDTSNQKTPQILMVSLGSRKDFQRNVLRDAYASASRMLSERKIQKAGIAYVDDARIKDHFEVALEGFLLATYRFDHYKNEKNGKKRLSSIVIGAQEASACAEIEKGLFQIRTYAQATFMARDWINEPANIVNPSFMEKKALEIAKKQGLKIKILGESELKKMGMNLLVAVGMGSIERPRLVHLEYQPKGKAKSKVALVGKGVTFDSGGLSLKPQNNMYGMKGDMSGSAAVLATMWAVSELKPPVHVHGLLPLVENLPSDRSVKPGDVFVAHNKKSVEIENTDAEGRLILADALSYAKGLGVNHLIDVATLTGACVVALGEDIAGIFGNDEKLIDRICKASETAGEKFWKMPMEKSYARLLKSDVADLKNVGGKWAGAITAALFLSEFVGDVPWAHLDIAGPAFIERDWAICPKGGTGFGVRTFLEFLSKA